MALPTFVGSQPGPTWGVSGTTRSATITVQTGDRLVILATTEDNGITLSITGAGGQTWTAITGSPSNVASRCKVYGWTATSVTTGAITVTVTISSTSAAGLEIYALRNSDGFGNVVIASGSTDDPSFSLTMLGANSAVLMLRTDWNASDTLSAGASPATYRTASAGSFTERSAYRDGARYTTATGYHPDAGAAAAKTLGHTTPGTVTEAWVYAAVEVLGTAGGVTQVSSTRLLKYDILNNVASTRLLKWDLANLVASVRQLKWDILNNVSSTRLLKWDLAALVASVRQLVWDVGGNVASLRQLKWDILNNVASTRLLKWDLSNLVSSVRALKWDTAALVSSVRALQWDVNSAVAAIASAWRSLMGVGR